MADMQMSANVPAAGPVRSRKTSRRVRIVDRVTSIGITAGGLLVVVCVLGIMVYLVSVVAPLFQGATLSDRHALRVLEPAETSRVLFTEVDEYRTLGATLLVSGELKLFDARGGQALEQRELWPATDAPIAFRRDARSGRFALALPDGRLRLGAIAFESGFLLASEAGPVASLAPGAWAPWEGGLVERTPGGDLRRIAVVVTLEDAQAGAEPPAPVRLLDYRPGDAGAHLALWLTDGRLLRIDLGGESNFLTGEMTAARTTVTLPPPVPERGEPAFLRINTRGDELYVAWRDGDIVRYDLRDIEHPVVAERTDLIESPGVELGAIEWTLGERSLIAGDSTGGIAAWSRVPIPEDETRRPESPPPPDGFTLRRTHRPASGGPPVTQLAMSGRDKSFLAGRGDGSVAMYHLTSGQLLAEDRAAGSGAVSTLQIAPKGDGVLALTSDGQTTSWSLRNAHPETTLWSLFGRVWYEGFPEPAFVWQSSSGTDDFEPKLGLAPLVFGTLKATFYAMLFALPIALGAALYTSEFLDLRFRGPVKTTIELMASLPSVVLGFLAALVLAPLVEQNVLAILTGFGLLPLVALAFGYLLQVAPAALSLKLRGRIQFVILFSLLVAAAACAEPIAHALERALFAGDFKGWLDGRVGSGRSGLGVLLWPFSIIGLMVLDRRLVVPRLGRSGLSRSQVVAIEAAKFAVLVVTSVLLAWALATLGFAIGLDPRGVLLGTYVQRNALVVGFAMGFAVIPIIYTLSEDSLSSVPQSLRSASLGCGATRWQTATRVVLPVALPGIFSAVMVGLGRAVGETMIVLMAAGNTPVLDLNIFSGLRTLSANIAVELPEAVKDGTLYRVLFLAALTLFVLTFAFNTVAELVRQRLRKRYAQL